VASASINKIPQWCEDVETAVMDEDLDQIKTIETLIDAALKEVYIFLENYIAVDE
jgi:hypothetical protein